MCVIAMAWRRQQQYQQQQQQQQQQEQQQYRGQQVLQQSQKWDEWKSSQTRTPPRVRAQRAKEAKFGDEVDDHVERVHVEFETAKIPPPPPMTQQQLAEDIHKRTLVATRPRLS